jgi:hypothetical protein
MKLDHPPGRITRDPWKWSHIGMLADLTILILALTFSIPLRLSLRRAERRISETYGMVNTMRGFPGASQVSSIAERGTVFVAI